jgi:hypothetical protein
MASYPRRSRSASERYRLAQTGIPDYANKSLDEQVVLFSKLVMENRRRPIYRVWSKLDPIARSVIMTELGCFAGKDAPQLIRAQRDERPRKVLAELERHLEVLKEFVKTQAEHEYQIIYRLRFRNHGGEGYRENGELNKNILSAKSMA